MSGPPKRPKLMEDLGFRQAKMFRWLSPLGLLLTGAKVVISGTFAHYADKRELEAALPVTPVPDYSSEEVVWVDFVADLGDGFNSTYAMARLLAKESLEFQHEGKPYDTRRGRLLVMGGDQVYPTADENAYLSKFIGPYQAAFPWFQPDDQAPRLYALPGNHDWYDGLTSFMRLIGSRRWVGGWRTEQPRSYFAIKLPGRWWLWGIDIQFDTYIDEPQLSFFRRLAEGTLVPESPQGPKIPKVQQGDRIILCTGKPSWVHGAIAGDEKYKHAVEPRRNLQYFEAKVVRASGADVRIGLSGDLHHYARYQSDEGRQRITAGGGGAYLYPTHVLDEKIEWQDEGDTLDSSVAAATYCQKKIYPERKTSQRLRLGALLVPRTNPSFMVLSALVSLAVYWIVLFGLAPGGRGTAAALQAANLWQVALSLVRSPFGLLFCLLLFGGMYGFADAVRRGEKLLMGGLNALAQLAAPVLMIWGASRIRGFGGRPYLAVVALIIGVVGALVGSLLMGAYLVVCQYWLKRHPNENFSSQHIEDYKNFLRMRIESNGTVTIFPIGLDRVPKHWDVDPDGGDSAPYLVPTDGEEQPRLIEAPIEVKPPDRVSG